MFTSFGSLVFGVLCSAKMSSKKRKAEVNKQRKLDFFFSSSSASGKIVFNWRPFGLEHFAFESTSEIRPEWICRRCKWPNSCHTWTWRCCTLNNFYKKKLAISYLQICNINLVFLLLVYLSTNKGKTGKPNTSVVHGLHAYVPVIAMPDRNLVCP